MGSTIKILKFTMLGLFSYGAVASLPEITDNLRHNNERISAWFDSANHSKDLNLYALDNSSESDTPVLSLQFPNSEQVVWPYDKLTKQYGVYNSDHTDNIVSRIQSTNRGLTDELVVASEFSMGRRDEMIPEIIKDIPLPAAAWLFLGGLLAFLRVQR